MAHDDTRSTGALWHSEAARIAARGEALGIELAAWEADGGMFGDRQILRGFRIGETTFRWCRPLADMFCNLDSAEAVRRFLAQHSQPLTTWDGGFGWREGQPVPLMNTVLADGDYERADALEQDNDLADTPVGVCRNGAFHATDPAWSHQDGTPMVPPRPEPETVWMPLTPDTLANVAGH